MANGPAESQMSEDDDFSRDENSNLNFNEYAAARLDSMLINKSAAVDPM